MPARRSLMMTYDQRMSLWQPVISVKPRLHGQYFAYDADEFFENVASPARGKKSRM